MIEKRIVTAEVLKDMQSHKPGAPGEQPKPIGPVLKKGTTVILKIVRETGDWYVEERLLLFGGTIEYLIPKDSIKILEEEKKTYRDSE